MSETIQGSYNPVQFSSFTVVKPGDRAAAANEDVTERTVTSTHCGEDSTEDSSNDEILREVPCVLSSSSSERLPQHLEHDEEDDDDDDNEHELFEQEYLEQEEIIPIVVDSPARPTTSRIPSKSSPDSAQSVSPRDEYYYTHNPFSFPPGVNADIMDEESLRRLHDAVQEQLDLSFDSSNWTPRPEDIIDNAFHTDGTSAVEEEMFMDEDTIDTGGDDTFDTGGDDTFDTFESADGGEKKKSKKSKKKKSKKSSKKVKKSSRKHSSKKDDEAVAAVLFESAEKSIEINDKRLVEDVRDDGLGITSGLDDTMHHRRIDPPGERQYAAYELEEATDESVDRGRRSKKSSKNKHSKRKSSSRSSSSKRKSKSDPSSPHTPSTKGSSSSSSSTPSEWELAKARFHRAANSPSRPFVPPKRREIRPANWLPGDLREARGVRDFKKRVAPPPLLAEDNDDFTTEKGRNDDLTIPESYPLAGPEKFKNVDEFDPFSMFMASSTSSTTGRSLASSDVEQQGATYLFPSDGDDNDYGNDTLGDGILNKSDSKDSVGMRERLLYWLCRLFIVAGLVLVVLGIVSATRHRRDDGKSITSTLPPTLSPAPSTLMPTANQQSREEWAALGQVLHGSQSLEQFGSSVAMSADGSTLAVGAIQPSNAFGRMFDGYVQVLRFDVNTSQWMPMGEIIQNEVNGDDYGYAVSLSADGRTLAASVISNNLAGRGNGQARVFRYVEAVMEWEQIGQDQFTGYFHDDVVLSDDGNTVAFVRNTDQMGENSAVVSRFNGTDWEQLGQELGGLPDGVSVAFIDVSADGSTIAIGGDAYDENLNGVSGILRILRYSAETELWEPLGQSLVGFDTYDGFGSAFALSADGTKIVASAAYYSTEEMSNVGLVRVFEFDATSTQWYPLGQGILGEYESETFGRSLALSADGRVFAAGSPREEGRVKVFAFDESSKSWFPVGSTLEGIAGDDQFGYAVALSADGQSVVGSSRWHDFQGEDTGQVRVYRLNSSSVQPKSTSRVRQRPTN